MVNNFENECKSCLSSKRTVAFLDILGFKELCKIFPSTVIGNTLRDAIKSAINGYKEWCKIFGKIYSECKIFTFSDSIAIFSHDHTKNSFLSVVLHTQYILQHLIVRQFPIRGAIAFGDVFMEENPIIFLGDGYKKAVELEKIQNWIGVSICNSAINEFSDYFDKEHRQTINLPKGKKYSFYSHPSIIRYAVPTKSGQKIPFYTINWTDRLLDINENGNSITDSDLIKSILKITKPDKKNIKRYLATLEYIEFINSIIQVHPDGTIRYTLNSEILNNEDCGFYIGA